MSILLWQILKVLFIVLDHVTVLSISFPNVTVFKIECYYEYSYTLMYTCDSDYFPR